MKKETNVKRTGCYIRRNRFILGAAAGLLLAAALPFGALGAEKGWQMVDGAERYVDETGGIVTEQWKKRDGKSYYLDENGEIAADAWIQGTWHVDETGAMERKHGSTRMVPLRWRKAGTIWDPAARRKRMTGKSWEMSGTALTARDGCATGWHYENGDIYYLGDENQGYTQIGWRYLESDGRKGRQKELFPNRWLPESPEDSGIILTLRERPDGQRWAPIRKARLTAIVTILMPTA